MQQEEAVTSIRKESTVPQIVYLRRPDEQPGVYTVTLPPPSPEPRIRVPDRAPAPLPKPQPRSVDAEDVDPATWRRIELLAWKPDEETCDIVLLRPTWWIEQAGAKVGALIRLAMPEMGVDGPAKVLSIGPCPRMQERKPGTRVVTGTFKHKAKLVLHLHLEGLDKPIGVTPNHPIYSLDRAEFIPAGKLRVGERLKTHTSVSAVVTEIVAVPGEQAVYNLEVHR